MKRKSLISSMAVGIICICTLQAYAQDSYVAPPNFSNTPKAAAPVKTDSLRKVYLGLGTGVNNYTGMIGVGIDIRAYKSFFIRMGVGIGGWGTKFTIGGRYELNEGTVNGWVFGLSYSRCSGLKNFTYQLQVDTAGTIMTKNVALDLYEASTVNFTAAYNWYIHKHTKFYLETGYSLALQTDPYKVTDGSVLTTVSEQTLHLLTPGGLMIAAGFMFPL